jgi:tetraacyldisaccharide 4'-kinase
MTVGGTGKTPMVILLAEWLHAQGRRVSILSRGYKRTSQAPYLLVSDGSRIMASPSEAGDEPFLMAQRCPYAIVAVGADRVSLGRWVLGQFQVDCMILDDGFQHRALYRDVDLVLLDATDATGLDAMLPAGRLREPLNGLEQVSAIAITRADSPRDVEAIRIRLKSIVRSDTDIMEVVFRPECLVAVGSQIQQPIVWGQKKRTWLVSGIGNSNAFRRSAESIGMEVVGETVFKDHHEYSQADVQQVQDQVRRHHATVVLTTEKDAAKLSGFLPSGHSWWMLRLRPEVVRGEVRLRQLVTGSPTEAVSRVGHA